MIVNRTILQNFLFLLYFFVINFESLDPFSTGGTFSLSKAVGILFIVSALPSFKILFNLNKSFSFTFPFISFLLILTLISLLNINSYSSKFFDFAIVSNFFLFVLIINHAQKDLMILERGMLIFASGAILSSFLLVGGIGINEIAEGRISIFNENANVFAIRLAAAMIIIYVFLKENIINTAFLRTFFIFSLPFMGLAILETGSRSAIAVLLAGFIVWIFIRLIQSKNRILTMLTSIFLAAILLIPSTYLFLQLDFSMVERVLETVESGDLGGRSTLWLSYIFLVLERPITGFGFSGFAKEALLIHGIISSPHNVILEVMLYTGLLGSAFYIYFMVKIIRAALKNYTLYGRTLSLYLVPVVLIFILANQALAIKFVWLLMSYIVGSFLLNKEMYLIKKN